MKRFIKPLSLSLLILSLGTIAQAEAVTTSQSETPVQKSEEVKWLTNYEEGLIASKKTGKPLVLFFTGSDWCSWCKKLEKEVLNQPEFAQQAADKFVFVKLDFPRKSTMAAEESMHNEALKKTFEVQGFPTLIILNDHAQTIARTGYKAGGPRKYAEHLAMLVTEDSKKK